MNNNNFSESLIQPYKTIGEIIGGTGCNCLIKTGKKLNLAVSTSNSFKIFKLPDLKLQLLGPHLDGQIRCMAGANEHLFIAIGTKIYIYKVYHIEHIFECHPGVVDCLILFGEDLLISSDEFNLIIFTDVRTKQEINRMQVNYKIKQIVHPLTYLNKILVISDKLMELINIQTLEVIHQFQGMSCYLENQINTTILQVINSPILHRVAIALSNRKVLLFNLQSDQILFEFEQQNDITNMAFSLCEIPLLVVADITGSLTFWNLNEQKLFSSIKMAHKNPQNDQQCNSLLEFLPEIEEIVLLSGSASDNSILQWQYDENEINKFKIVRQRVGLIGNIVKVRFYNELHLLASSDNQQAELRDFSLLNDLMSVNFSLKVQKKNISITGTETTKLCSSIVDFRFARNRENDFANILTFHKNSHRPCFWSYQNHTILKQKIKIYNDPSQITAVFVTNCGNFGFIGFENGEIMQINLQSTIIQNQFQTGKKITSLFVDNYNKYIVAGDCEGSLYFFDFFSKQLMDKKFVGDQYAYCEQIIGTKEYSILFLVILSDFSLQVWDLQRKLISRKFIGHTDKILDACFSSDNRQVFSCSDDFTFRIWDIISGKPIQCLTFDQSKNKKIISVNVSTDGELIATAFNNSREVNLWHNLTYMKPWGVKLEQEYFSFITPVQILNEKSRKEYYENNSNQTETVVNNAGYLTEIQEMLENSSMESKLANEKLPQFTDIPQGRWLPLIHLDEIKEKNKVILKDNEAPKLPFFLDFESKDAIQKQLKSEGISTELNKSKIIQKQREDRISEVLGNQMNEFISGNINKQELFDYLKQLTPSEIDYEFRRNCLGNPQTLQKMLKFFYEIVQMPQDFDLKQIYLHTLLNICYDNLMLQDSNVVEFLKKIESVSGPQTEGLIQKILANSCLIEKFAKIRN